MRTQPNRVYAAIRREFAPKFIGATDVEVHKLGTIRPNKIADACMYLPIPELGICLLKRYPKESK